MSLLSPPRVEGTVLLHDGRALGYAEYGSADGDAVLWFHGTPGGRRQIPPVARRVAVERGLRLVAVERPGVGGSTTHLHDDLTGFAHDVAELTDRLGIGRFGVIGLSGGGPYVLACAHELPTRVVAGAVLGGVAPTRGEEAAPGGLVNLATRFAPLVRAFRAPLGRLLWGFGHALQPADSQALALYMRISPEGDRRVFSRPEMQEMFLDDFRRAMRDRFDAPVLDLLLFTRHWGFRLRDVQVPIRFWHGDADHIVPLAHGEHQAELVPDSELRVRPGESHLGSLDASEEILDAILALWPDRKGALRVIGRG